MATAPSNERPIVIRRIKKVSGGGHHGGAWKVAYADFVTAMMAFFMLLWLISSPDEELREGLADYFSPAEPSPSSAAASTASLIGDGEAGFASSAQARNSHSNGTPSAEAATAGVARGGTADVPDAALRVVAEELRIALEQADPESKGRNVEMEQDSNSLRISLTDTTGRPMFRSGTAELNGFARNMLTRVAKAVAPTGVQVAIEGHTDDAGGRSGGNWRLSGERAQAAYTAMLAAGLGADRFSGLTAMADSKPVYPDQPGRPENRRITIILQAEGSALPPDTSFKF